MSFRLMRSRLAEAASIADLRSLAKRRIPRPLFDFIDGGAGGERTLHRNETAFEQWRLIPRVAVDVSGRSSAASILGRTARLPLVLAPTGLAGLFYPNGELLAARAATQAGVPFCISTNSIASLEEVAAAVPEADLWFQLYFLRDRDWMNALVTRARTAGYKVLCVTLDLPVAGRRDRDIRNAFTTPLRPTARNFFHILSKPSWLAGALRGGAGFGNFEGATEKSGPISITQHVAGLFDPSVTWDDVARLRERWNGQIVVKGVLHPEDARRAAELGAAAVIVSNHGGRQLDGALAALDALPDIVDALEGRCPVILDGGVRRGSDVIVAIALGASVCMIGRAFLWGLAAAGAAGVSRALQILAEEFDNGLALLGARSVHELSPRFVVRSPTGLGR